MSVYSIDKLMKETRRLAAEYHQTTGQTLPVTQELARYDVKSNLNLAEPNEVLSGVDAISTWEFGSRVQIKGRVIFKEDKQRQRIGQMNLDGQWDCVALVLYASDYFPSEIYLATREEIEQALTPDKQPNKRGIMSVAKFKAIGRMLWSCPDASPRENHDNNKP